MGIIQLNPFLFATMATESAGLVLPTIRMLVGNRLTRAVFTDGVTATRNSASSRPIKPWSTSRWRMYSSGPADKLQKYFHVPPEAENDISAG